MTAVSRDQAPIELELDVAESRTVDAGGMTIAFERLSAGVETAPLFVGLPDDACQSPHWGYLLRGRFRVVRPDGARGGRRGRPGVLPARPGTTWSSSRTREIVEFSPAEDRRRTMEHAAQLMAAAGA